MNRLEKVAWSQLAGDNDPLGVGCDDEGPRIGPIRLLTRTTLGFRPRWTSELEFVVGKALERPVQFANKRRGLEAVADALDNKDLARAMLITQFMRLPSLPDRKALERAFDAESLVKAGFNPDQRRDERGRWTEDGDIAGVTLASTPAREAGFTPVQEFVFPQGLIPWLEQVRPAQPLPATPPFPGEIVVPPALTVPRTLDNPFPRDRGCREEWEDAKKYCQRLDDEGKLGQGDYKEHGRYYEQCVRGQVSERCGGNPVGRGRSNFSMV